VDTFTELKDIGARDGTLFGGGRQRLALKYILRCACGKEFEWWASDFIGKRLMRDCGCGAGDDGGMTLEIKVRISSSVYEIIKEYLKTGRGGATMSHAVGELIEMGWARHLEKE
jgi:hypothetical protein